MEIAIVKYNAGNICSVENALLRLGIQPIITDDADKLCHADGIVFPGQGEAKTAMTYLQNHGLDQVIVNLRQPLLGICIGMQLLCQHSEEGNTDCLGIFNTSVKRFCPQTQADKVPQMGWNQLQPVTASPHPLLKNVPTGAYAYFIHSYYVPLCDHTVAQTDYTQTYSSVLHKDNFYATQFHPEKSGQVGEQILSNFLNIVATNSARK